MPPKKVAKKSGKKSSWKSSKSKTPWKSSETAPKPVEAPTVVPELPKNLCVYHGKPIQYFCENADEPICYDCTVMGPYNTQLHWISSIPDAFGARLDLVTQAIHKTLIPKRSQLIA